MSFKVLLCSQVTPATRPMSLGRTGSFSQLGGGKTSPTPSQTSQSSSSHYAYPYSMGVGHPGSSASNSPYSTVYLPLSKRSASKEDDRKSWSHSVLARFCPPGRNRAAEILSARAAEIPFSPSFSPMGRNCLVVHVYHIIVCFSSRWGTFFGHHFLHFAI